MLSSEVGIITVIVALIAYTATCIDDFCHLVKFNGQVRNKENTIEYRDITIGFLLAFTSIIGISLIGGLCFGAVIPSGYIQLLGLLPFFIGFKKICELLYHYLSKNHISYKSIFGMKDNKLKTAKTDSIELHEQYPTKSFDNDKNEIINEENPYSKTELNHPHNSNNNEQLDATTTKSTAIIEGNNVVNSNLVIDETMKHNMDSLHGDIENNTAKIVAESNDNTINSIVSEEEKINANATSTDNDNNDNTSSQKALLTRKGSTVPNQPDKAQPSRAEAYFSKMFGKCLNPHALEVALTVFSCSLDYVMLYFPIVAIQSRECVGVTIGTWYSCALFVYFLSRSIQSLSQYVGMLHSCYQYITPMVYMGIGMYAMASSVIGQAVTKAQGGISGGLPDNGSSGHRYLFATS